MMSLILSVPGKSFFAGEYSALNGGPAIMVATAPRFELKVTNGSGWMNGIHGDSPAGQLVKKHALFFNQFDLEFIDPHIGRGGWGASTAQFLTCYALLQWQNAAAVDSEKYFDTHQMLNTYRELAWNGHGLPPSGADLIGQLKGGFTYFEKRRGLITELRWPFEDLEFYLIPTGNKVATHEHLQGLTAISTSTLENYVRQVQDSLIKASKSDLIEGLNHFSKELELRHWTDPKTLEMLKTLNSIPGVLASKGCGALGADVVLAVRSSFKG
jgi:mevalonate kinase